MSVASARAVCVPCVVLLLTFTHKRVFHGMERLAALRLCRRCSSSTVRLLPPALEQRLKPGAAVEHTIPVRDRRGDGVRLLNLIVVCDASGSIRAFENYCPHQAGRLFLEPGGALQCRLHGAKFDVQASGKCTSGPCVGERLNALPLAEAPAGEGLSVTLEALLRLQQTGSGGRPPPSGWQPNGIAKALLEAFEGHAVR